MVGVDKGLHEKWLSVGCHSTAKIARCNPCFRKACDDTGINADTDNDLLGRGLSEEAFIHGVPVVRQLEAPVAWRNMLPKIQLYGLRDSIWQHKRTSKYYLPDYSAFWRRVIGMEYRQGNRVTPVKEF